MPVHVDLAHRNGVLLENDVDLAEAADAPQVVGLHQSLLLSLPLGIRLVVVWLRNVDHSLDLPLQVNKARSLAFWSRFGLLMLVLKVGRHVP
jgi:hypothetical protein